MQEQLAAAEARFEEEHLQYEGLLAANAEERAKLDRTQEALNALSTSTLTGVGVADEASVWNTSSTVTAAGE